MTEIFTTKGLDQAARLRDMAQSRKGSGLTVAVVSGKGGVGKTNVAVNLSVCAAEMGMRVTLVDLDLGLANADVLLNMQSPHGLAHVLSGERSLEEVAAPGPYGLRFVAGLANADDLSPSKRGSLLLQLRKLARNTEMLVMDCAAGVSRNVTDFASIAAHVLVVTTPEPTALTDAYATVKVLRRMGSHPEVALVVNMADSRLEAQTVYKRLAGVAQKFLNYSVADGGYLLHDTAVEQAVRTRCPFVIRYPGSNAAACITAVLGNLTHKSSGCGHRGGLLRRVAGLFV